MRVFLLCLVCAVFAVSGSRNGPRSRLSRESVSVPYLNYVRGRLSGTVDRLVDRIEDLKPMFWNELLGAQTVEQAGTLMMRYSAMFRENLRSDLEELSRATKYLSSFALKGFAFDADFNCSDIVVVAKRISQGEAVKVGQVRSAVSRTLACMTDHWRKYSIYLDDFRITTVESPSMVTPAQMKMRSLCHRLKIGISWFLSPKPILVHAIKGTLGTKPAVSPYEWPGEVSLEFNRLFEEDDEDDDDEEEDEDDDDDDEEDDDRLSPPRPVPTGDARPPPPRPVPTGDARPTRPEPTGDALSLPPRPVPTGAAAKRELDDDDEEDDDDDEDDDVRPSPPRPVPTGDALPPPPKPVPTGDALPPPPKPVPTGDAHPPPPTPRRIRDAGKRELTDEELFEDLNGLLDDSWL